MCVFVFSCVVFGVVLSSLHWPLYWLVFFCFAFAVFFVGSLRSVDRWPLGFCLLSGGPNGSFGFFLFVFFLCFWLFVWFFLFVLFCFFYVFG